MWQPESNPESFSETGSSSDSESKYIKAYTCNTSVPHQVPNLLYVGRVSYMYRLWFILIWPDFRKRFGIRPRLSHNMYWIMWKPLMFCCTDTSQVLHEIVECKKAYPIAYIRCSGVWFSITLGKLIVCPLSFKSPQPPPTS